MKLIFDQNLSPRLVTLLDDLFPDSSHVHTLGLERSSDWELWSYARDSGLTVVTKDADMSDLSTLHGFPPKLIWIQLGNCTTSEIERLLRSNFDAISQMHSDPDTGIISLM